MSGKVVNFFKEWGHTLKTRGVEIELKQADLTQEAEIKKIMEIAFSEPGEKAGLSEWDCIKPKQREKMLDILYTENVYNALSLYEGEKQTYLARKMFSFANESFVKLDGFARLMGEEAVFNLLAKNEINFTKAITRIYSNEFTELMIPSYVLMEPNQRVAFYAVRAIGKREGAAAQARLETVVNYIDSMGNDSGLFSGTMMETIDEAKRVLSGFIKEDEINEKGLRRKE